MGEKNRVLIIGSGGREHALGWKLAQSTTIGKIYFAPGNSGTGSIGENIDINPDDIAGLAQLAKDKHIDLTIVGPELPLTLGIVDLFERKNLPIFGPTKKGAALEGSKAWATEFMTRHGVPHPPSVIAKSYRQALLFIEKPNWANFVIKADGPAAGKGVHLPNSLEEARQSITNIMKNRVFGKAGETVVFQEKMEGKEISVVTIVSGNQYQILPLAKDRKRIFDHDKGPNTGGMGTYAPAQFVEKSVMNLIEKEIIKKTLAGLQKEEIRYRGFLYFGLIITAKGPVVIEYNVRLGDPETQSQLPLLNGDLFKVLQSSFGEKIIPLRTSKKSAVCVVLAAPEYPQNPQTGQIVKGLTSVSKKKNVLVFHAGTKKVDDNITVSGGRALNVVGLGSSIKEAQKNAYSTIGKDNNGVYFDKMQFRNDIGKKA